MFINFTNHACETWSEEQLKAAREYGEIVEVRFPNVPVEYSPEEISAMAHEYAEMIKAYNPSCVLCQGEFTLAFGAINALMNAGVKVVAACSKRIVVEDKDENGNIRKTAIFKFEGFREYRR